MEYVKNPKIQIFNIKNKPWLKDIYKCIEAPSLTLFDKAIAANKSTMTILQNKAMEIAKRTTLTYPEAQGVFIDYFRQNSKSMENISVEEVLEFLKGKNEKHI